MKYIITFCFVLGLSITINAQDHRLDEALELYHKVATHHFDVISKGDTLGFGDYKWGTHKLKDMYPTAKYGYYTATSMAVIHELKKDLAINPRNMSEILSYLEVEYRKRFPKLPDSFYSDISEQIKSIK